MIVVVPSSPSAKLKPIIPSLSSLVSVPSANSALKSPRSHSSQLSAPAKPPNHFPLFPHPVNIARTETPANPSSSIVYFTTLCIPGGGAQVHPTSPRSSSTRRPTSVTPLDATFTKNSGVGISTSLAIASELLARNVGSSLPVLPFDSKLWIEDPDPFGTVDLLFLPRPLASRDTRKSFISNAYKKTGGPPPCSPSTRPPHYSLFTTHYPLLTAPDISLHYAFEATHDS
jgi:hypothetical protein